ncbi:MAG: YdiU family protein [Polyangiales bacterium]
MPVDARYRPDPVVTRLGDGFYDVVEPARFPEQRPRFFNEPWAARVGLGPLTDDERRAHFADFAPLPDNLPAPLALRYHGHQFQTYNPALGDGRGFLFAQLRDPVDGRLLDLATKGSSRTPYSRGADGRLTLKGGVREVLATEMLEALGVYTSKTFSLFETGERLMRGDEPSPTRSSVLVRLGHSHVRFGSFERHAHHRDVARLARLVDYAIEHYAPELASQPGEPAPKLLREVTRRSAELVASWMIAGFVHGVLNTDNMNVTGESFDYGPYRFLPTYDVGFTAAYFDHGGLYAFGRQPAAVRWNLERFAEALAPLATFADLDDALSGYERAVMTAVHRRFTERLGVVARGEDHDDALVDVAYAFLRESQVGYDRFFFDWYAGAASEARAKASPSREMYEGAAFEKLKRALEGYAPSRPEALSEAYFQRAEPCSLLIDEIEAIWAFIDAKDDWSMFHAKVEDIRAMGRAYGRGAGA